MLITEEVLVPIPVLGKIPVQKKTVWRLKTEQGGQDGEGLFAMFRSS